MDWRTVLTKEFISVFGFLILVLFVRTNNKMRHSDKKLFYFVIITGIAELLAFEAELITAALAEPTTLRILFSVIGYTLRPILVYLLILISDKSQASSKRKVWLAIPCIVCFFSVNTAFFSRIAFWYDGENQFHRGVLGYVPHIIAAFYFLLYAYVSCKHIRRQGRLDSMVAISISVFAICALIIDTFVSAGGTTRIAIMLCTFFSYVRFQNKALFSMIDEIPGAIARLTIRNGKYLFVSFNDSLCRMFGLSREQFGKATRDNAFSLLQEDERLRAEQAMELLRRREYSSFRFKLHTGTKERYYSVALKVAGRTGDEIDIYGTMLDVTRENRMLDDLRMRNDEIALLMDQIGKIVCIYDVPSRTLTMTEKCAKARGYSSNTAIVPDETLSRHLISDESAEQYAAFYDKIFKGEHSGNIVAKFNRPDGSVRWEKTDFVTILNESGKPSRAIISIEDITKTHEEKLLLESYRNTLDNLIGEDKFCVLYDLTEQKVVASDGGLLPITEDFKNKTLEDIAEYLITHYVRADDADVVREFLSHETMASSYKSNILHRHIERVAIMPDGAEKWFRLNVYIGSVNGKNTVATLLWENIDSEYRARHDLMIRANYDTLTGVLTRNATMQEIGEYLSGEGKNGTHALIMMDMDNLKGVNDNLGHQVGDMALRDFANGIRRFFRQGDIVGRIGGDEFFVFVKNAERSALSTRMPELLLSLTRAYSENDRQVTTAGSAGIAMYRGDSAPNESLTELYARADAALYKSKASGKNTFTFSEESDDMQEGEGFDCTDAPTESESNAD